jgi:hypothetical protein
VNHSVIASIRYLVPKRTKSFDDRILNPGYEPNPLLGYAAVDDTESYESTEEDELDEVLGNPSANDGFWDRDYSRDW